MDVDTYHLCPRCGESQQDVAPQNRCRTGDDPPPFRRGWVELPLPSRRLLDETCLEHVLVDFDPEAGLHGNRHKTARDGELLDHQPLIELGGLVRSTSKYSASCIAARTWRVAALMIPVLQACRTVRLRRCAAIAAMRSTLCDATGPGHVGLHDSDPALLDEALKIEERRFLFAARDGVSIASASVRYLPYSSGMKGSSSQYGRYASSRLARRMASSTSPQPLPMSTMRS